MLRITRRPIALALLGLLAAALPAGAADAPPDLLVSVSNAVENVVLVSERAPDGRLTVVQSIPTGEAGTGAYLHTSGAVARLGEDRVLVVNAGSDSVSVLVREEGRLRLQATFPSLGSTPTSIAVHGDRVYVMSTGIPSENDPDPTPRIGDPVVQGFTVDAEGDATPIPGARAALPGACDAYPCEASSIFGQVAVAPDGGSLLVTLSNQDRILSWSIDADGALTALPDAETTVPAPYGLAWARSGIAVVVGARGPQTVGEVMTGSVGAGGWQPATAMLAMAQSNACWAALSPAQDRAYIVNAGTYDPSDPEPGITTLSLAPDGEVTILGATAIAWDEDRFPVDSAVSTDGRTLYSLSDSGYYVYDIAEDGTAVYAPEKEVLTPETMLGAGATGLVILPSA